MEFYLDERGRYILGGLHSCSMAALVNGVEHVYGGTEKITSHVNT